MVRLTRLARAGLLWSVSRQLVLSYVLVGAVPILLTATFAFLALLLLLFDFSSYLVQDRVAHLTEQAHLFAQSTLFEAERGGSEAAEIARRRQSSLSIQYPGVAIRITPAAALPAWLPSGGFSGLTDRGQLARAVVISSRGEPRIAVVVDLPIRAAIGETALTAAGLRLGDDRPRSIFNTATFLTYVDWESGRAEQATVGISVDVRALYDWLSTPQMRRANAAVPENVGQDAVPQGALSSSRIFMYVLAGVGILLLVIESVALGNGLALARSIASSVDELFAGTERVTSGDFQHRVAVRSKDQLGELAQSFNEMTGRIEGLLREQDEKRRLEEELRIAREIQMSLLPQGSLAARGAMLAALCAPAREVGGDYYDFLPLPDGRVGMLIADVSGKGTSAAFYMAELKGLMLSLSRIHSSPRALLVEANRIISQHLDSRSFITATYAIFDPANASLTCARAGHTPFVRVSSRSIDGPAAEILAPDGMVLGLNLDRGERFERSLQELVIPVAEGDVFGFFTDGVSEAMDHAGACFGEQRISEFLVAHRDLPPEAIRDRLLNEVGAFANGAPQHDDITMVILKIGPEQSWMS